MIEVSHLSCGYGDKTILDDVSFSVPEGMFVAVMGSNGCGKTTLLRCLTGLLTPTVGTVSIDGRKVGDYSVRRLAQKVAFVQQRVSADFDFSAFETVLMGRNPYQRRLQNESREDWDIVERCMKNTNTWHLRLSLPSQMSGGELQRVMIARALAQQTPVLLLDEPTSSLDIAHQIEIMELLKTINSQHRKTIMIVVHDLDLAMRFCPYTMLLHNHQLFFQGSTGEALTPDNIATVFGVRAKISGGHVVIEGAH